MDRRKFFGLLTATAAGLLVAERSIFLPPRGGWPTGKIMLLNPGAEPAYYNLITEAMQAALPNCVVEIASGNYQAPLDFSDGPGNVVIRATEGAIVRVSNGGWERF